MNIIITMAGEGRRFKNTGTSLPKYMIGVKQKTMFEWALSTLKNFYDNKFIFITRKSHNAYGFIKEKCGLLGIKDVNIKEIDYLTGGQASTVLEAEEKISDLNEEIIVYNIDTYVEPNQLKPEDIKGDGWIPAFKAEGNRWSFVEFDDNLKIVKLTEKVRISEFGTIGLYYFKSFALFKKCYTGYVFNGYGEEYVIPIYNVMLDDPHLNLYTHIVDENAVHVLGTPDDLKLFA